MISELKRLEHRFRELYKKDNKTLEEIDEKESLRIRLEKAYREDEQPLINDLDKVGIKVNSCWDLVNSKSSYKKAIPILLEHLPKPYHIKNKEGIVRALAVKEAKGIACRGILDEYQKSMGEGALYRWAFGNTIETIITKDYLEDVLNIVQNKENRSSREMFVMALGKIKSLQAEEVLMGLLEDEEVVLHAIFALGKLRSQKSKAEIEKRMTHKNKFVRAEAKKALKKINQSS